MTIELLQTLSTAAFLAGALFLIVAVVLFFLLDVPKLYGDVSGRTAKKAIEAIRHQNEQSGNKAYKPSAVNVERGKLTDKMTNSGKIYPRTTAAPIGVGTEKLCTEELVGQAPETTLLEAAQTTLLETAQTTLLEVGQTQPGQTAALEPVPQSSQPVSVDVELSFTASSEIIE